MNRILVIGAKGMLGRDLVPQLLFAFPGDEVLAWDIDEIDIRKEEETISKIEKIQPTTVINLAGYTDVDGCETNEREAFAVNADGMKHIAAGARRCGAKAIYLSTDYVFDGKKGTPYVEDDLPNPINLYGHSKWKGEQYALELGKDGLIIRTQWLYGRHGKNFVTTILRLSNEKKVLPIVSDQIGSPTYTVDLSKAIIALIRKGASGIYHVANRDGCSWYDFGRTILRLWGAKETEVLPISSKELDRRAVRPSYSVLDTEKFSRETEVTLRPWPDALKDYLSELKKT
jgi:dTDP-4-dehydrorhamnose reductase